MTSPASDVLLLATGNLHKRQEMERMLADLPITLKTLEDYPGVAEAVEDGESFEENARRKAQHYARATGCTCVADDSGLEVDALGGRPGVFSARYAGEGASDADNRSRLLTELSQVAGSGRRARFVCVAVLADHDGVCFSARGTVEGTITETERGDGGFGYDPLFHCTELERTFAECSDAEKDRVSHRGRAFRQLLGELEQRFEQP